jgi:hypothetical protein
MDVLIIGGFMIAGMGLFLFVLTNIEEKKRTQLHSHA